MDSSNTINSGQTRMGKCPPRKKDSRKAEESSRSPILGSVNLIEASFGFFKDPDGQLSLRVDFHCRVIFTRVST